MCAILLTSLDPSAPARPGGAVSNRSDQYRREGTAMRNHITVTIAEQDYTLVAAEDEAYVRKVAAHVDSQVRSVNEDGRISAVNAAILAALNIADEYYKEQEASENLRRQLKESSGGGHAFENGALRGQAGDLQAAKQQEVRGFIRPCFFIHGGGTMLELLSPAGSMEAPLCRTAPTRSTWVTATSTPAATRKISARRSSPRRSPTATCGGAGST